MPNQRKADKKRVGVWLSPDEVEALKAVAERLGMTQSEVLKRGIIDALKEDEAEHGKDLRGNGSERG